MAKSVFSKDNKPQDSLKKSPQNKLDLSQEAQAKVPEDYPSQKIPAQGGKSQSDEV
ncbi:MAG: hypothetical protein K0S11_920 [Gammaproteobacteria bacterium]|jgi:hypothetical protein|nr:hypothetical protein [Gammaproteobacteria bacterium]